MSSASATVAAGRLVWFHPATQNNQLPAVGVPLPPPTEVELFSAITVDSRAGGVFPQVAGCANVAAQAFGTETATPGPPRFRN